LSGLKMIERLPMLSLKPCIVHGYDIDLNDGDGF
jgi:hypothetical protein